MKGTHSQAVSSVLEVLDVPLNATENGTRRGDPRRVSEDHPRYFMWGGKLRQAPEDFAFPSVPVSEAWRLWFEGNPAQGIVPYRFLKPSDVPKCQRKNRSDWEALMKHLITNTFTVLPSITETHLHLPAGRSQSSSYCSHCFAVVGSGQR